MQTYIRNNIHPNTYIPNKSERLALVPTHKQNKHSTKAVHGYVNRNRNAHTHTSTQDTYKTYKIHMYARKTRIETVYIQTCERFIHYPFINMLKIEQYLLTLGLGPDISIDATPISRITCSQH